MEMPLYYPPPKTNQSAAHCVDTLLSICLGWGMVLDDRLLTFTLRCYFKSRYLSNNINECICPTNLRFELFYSTFFSLYETNSVQTAIACQHIHDLFIFNQFVHELIYDFSKCL